MKSMLSILAAASALALAGAAQADTRDTNKDKATMEKNAAPSAPVKQEEERTGAHSQPDKPSAGGTSAETTRKPAKGTAGAKQKPEKESPSTGASAPSSSLPSPDRDAAFKLADMDGDGSVSKAEAAGNEQVVKGFDRADRNRDGKLTRAEYERIFAAKSKSGARAAAK